MILDLRNSLNNGMNSLLTWRNRYTKSEYPEKVVLNILYSKYTLEFVFSDIIGCFEKNMNGKPIIRWSDFNDGFKFLMSKYESTAILKTRPNLPSLLRNISRIVGNTSYEMFQPLILGAKNKDYSKLEEIEFAYLYYLLTDDCILYWGAFGGTGLTKIEAIGKISGLIIDTPEINTYLHIENILGQFYTLKYLQENYKKLPPNV